MAKTKIVDALAGTDSGSLRHEQQRIGKLVPERGIRG